METQGGFSTKPLLRPEQAQNAKDEIKSLEAKLANKYIEDKAEVQRQLRRARKDFESQLPRPPVDGDEEGRMVRRSKQLLAQITEGMPSMEEMRKAPPGAVDKHRAWESRNKPRIMEWKHIMLRLTAGSDDRDAANLEKHRPRASTLSMDNAFIPGKQIHLPESADGLGVTFSDEQLAALRRLDPELTDRIGSLTNSQRGAVKEIVGGIGLAPDPVASAAGKLGVEKQLAGKKGRKPMTPERLKVLSDQLTKARAAAKAKREAKSEKE